MPGAGSSYSETYSEVLTPNRVIDMQGSWVNVGGAASFDAALADNSDTTYCRHPESGFTYHPLVIGFTPMQALPPRSTITQVGGAQAYTNHSVRVSSDVAGQGVCEIFFRLAGTPYSYAAFDSFGPYGTTPQDFSTIISANLNPLGFTWSEADLQGLEMWFLPSRLFGYPNSFRIYRAGVQCYYTRPPTLTITGPVDEDAGVAGVQIVSTSAPILTWTYADVEGNAQERYVHRVFQPDQYYAPGFDPERTTPLWTSGEVYSTATSSRVGLFLPNGTYRSYLSATDTASVGQFSIPVYLEYTLNVPLPPVPVMTLSVG